jgi:hypothetical protein
MRGMRVGHCQVMAHNPRAGHGKVQTWTKGHPDTMRLISLCCGSLLLPVVQLTSLATALAYYNYSLPLFVAQ